MLSWGQRGKGDGGNSLSNRRGEPGRHPRGENNTDEGEDCAKGALRNRFDDRRGNEGSNIRIERLGRVEREEVGEETGGVRRSHRGTGDGVGSGLGSDPGRHNGQT